MNTSRMRTISAVVLAISFILGGLGPHGTTDGDAKNHKKHHRDSEDHVTILHDVGAETHVVGQAHWTDPVVEAIYYGPDDIRLDNHMATWTAINAALPADATTHFIPRYGGADCPPRPQYARPFISVCLDPQLAETKHISAWTGFSVHDGRIWWADIVIDDAYANNAHFHCHEAMHASTAIGDNHNAQPDTSCVWGSLTAPGPFDVEQLAMRYTPAAAPPPAKQHPRCDDARWAHKHPKHCD